MWDLNYDTNELIYKTETVLQIWRTGLWLPRRGGRWMGWEFGIRNAIFYTEEINNKVLPHSTRYNIQYPVISRKNIKKNIYRYN